MATAALTTAKKERWNALDALRGLILLSMLFYHAGYDLVALFGVSAGWFFAWPGFLWQQSICWGFILLSGMSCRLSHSNARRGLLTLGCGLLVELATRLFLPQQIIRFGILHFLGCAALLWALAAPLLDRLPAPALLAGSLALFLLTYALPWGGLGLGPLRLVTLPSGLYASPWLFWLGLPAPDFYSADYFPLLPWLFLFVAGAALCRLLAAWPPFARAARTRVPMLSALGRHTLLVYLMHQPLIDGMLWGTARLTDLL